MKTSAAAVSASFLALSTLCSAAGTPSFDKYSPWGKRDYHCLNVYQGIPENSTLTTHTSITLKWDRSATTICPGAAMYDPFVTGNYQLTLYNAVVRVPNGFSFDKQIVLKKDIAPQTREITVVVPDVPEVKDGSAWYLRLDTWLPSAPQTPTIFNAAGPFTIKK